MSTNYRKPLLRQPEIVRKGRDNSPFLITTLMMLPYPPKHTISAEIDPGLLHEPLPQRALGDVGGFGF